MGPPNVAPNVPFLKEVTQSFFGVAVDVAVIKRFNKTFEVEFGNHFKIAWESVGNRHD
ncbi:hypothetical protein TWF970_004267 [Orbilia oligospora]|uniref:Uncharacterized protein n=1 Tax=Orbilia oligospora TaxID=2813651 RepID=A0A7C8VF99_ORBOL|nr:hypothetical protein TWF970_004267 [Orbilia oligospora]